MSSKLILGLSAFYHDSAACVVVDGEIVAAAQEERFTRKKHDPGFPLRAIDYCLREAGATAHDIDYVVFYEKPFRKFERLLETYLAFAPSGFKSFSMALPVWLKEKIRLPSVIRHGLAQALNSGPAAPKRPREGGPLVFVDHHESHAASAFFPSPYDEAAILTLDGVGEWSTTTMGVGRGNKIQLTREIRFPHSLGLLYSAFTYYCGFKVNSGEYKLMGLAPYGRPVYKEAILEHLIDLKADGSFWLDMKYFNYCQGLTMTNGRFDALFGGSPRKSESAIEQRHMDLAASIQSVTEDAMLAMGRELHRETGLKKLVLAGGVALNCVGNGKLLREGPFDDIWIQPAAGDAGGALGAAMFVWHQLLENPRSSLSSPHHKSQITNHKCTDRQRGSLLGPRFSTEEVCEFLDGVAAPYHRAADEASLLDQIVKLLGDGNIIGWFQGRMEFGPRALGARSILGDPRSSAMQATMNLKIKFRESFRPFAPIVLEREASHWFSLKEGPASAGLTSSPTSPYMLLVGHVRAEHRLPITDEQRKTMASDPDLRARVNIPRSDIPAVTHVDYSARMQTVDEGRNPRLTHLLEAFFARTGCPVLVNTSFNVRGEPIVCTPQDAYRCFLATEMDALVMEDVIILKTDVDPALSAAAHKQHLSQFSLD